MTPMHALLANNKNQLQISIKLTEPKQFNGNTMQDLYIVVHFKTLLYCGWSYLYSH